MSLNSLVNRDLAEDNAMYPAAFLAKARLITGYATQNRGSCQRSLPPDAGPISPARDGEPAGRKGSGVWVWRGDWQRRSAGYQGVGEAVAHALLLLRPSFGNLRGQIVPDKPEAPAASAGALETPSFTGGRARSFPQRVSRLAEQVGWLITAPE